MCYHESDLTSAWVYQLDMKNQSAQVMRELKAKLTPPVVTSQENVVHMDPTAQVCVCL
jgi:hypothetical protein